jgi:hypothetical protein
MGTFAISEAEMKGITFWLAMLAGQWALAAGWAGAAADMSVAGAPALTAAATLAGAGDG